MKQRTALAAASSILAVTASMAFGQSVTLDVTAWKGNEAEPAGLAELIEKFESEHPDIDVELSYIGRLDTDTIIPPRLQGGNPPDVMMTDMPLVEVWGNAGLLENLGTDSEWYGRIPESLQAALTLNGNAFIMPLEVIGMGNFANMDLLAQAGVEEMPTTLDELKSACGALADEGINPMIFTGGFQAPLFLIANGLETTTNAAASLGSGDAKFAEDAAFNQGIDLIRDLIDARCFDPSLQAGLDPWSTALTEFQGGNFAMMPQGAWNIAAFKQIDGLNFAFGPIPTSQPSGVALDLFGIGWSIASGSENKDAARTFVDWFAQPENLQVMLDAESAYSPFDDGASGTPAEAAPYDAARSAGGIINYPFALLQWPKPLEGEIWDSLTGFLLDPSKPSEDVLTRWDEAVEDAF
ncbi:MULTISPECIES: ABC transporter substrate-binding protein [unclassified Ruegeria]|uniref:ABC transporter substrate-binding protein n=1 Tax=unclassified Ruegeria TaxID=2625375 RepID=UPI0014881B71|nr:MULTISPECIES: extracellular solute-binding protein [unclassified Ruegeria]